MNYTLRCLTISALISLAAPTIVMAQDGHKESESLKMAAIEALMVAPPEKALPVLKRVMASNNSDDIKSRALFILGQIDEPEAHELLLNTARSGQGELQLEAIRAIGISGEQALTSQLGEVYQSGDSEVRESVLHAYMIAGDSESVFTIASNATTDEDFEAAVQMLGVMGAVDELKQLRDHPGSTESLIQAYAIAGDTESLIAIASDHSDPERQMAAIHGMGIAGGDDVNAAMAEIYRSATNYEIKEAVMHGMMVAGDDAGVLSLFKSATDDREKADLLRMLVIMDSDAAMEAIDAALEGDTL